MDRTAKLRSHCDLCRAETELDCLRCGRPLCEAHLPADGQRCIDCEETFGRQERRLVRRCLMVAAALSLVGIAAFTVGVWWYYTILLKVDYWVSPGAILLYVSVVVAVFIVVIAVGGLFRRAARRAFLAQRRR